MNSIMDCSYRKCLTNRQIKFHELVNYVNYLFQYCSKPTSLKPEMNASLRGYHDKGI